MPADTPTVIVHGFAAREVGPDFAVVHFRVQASTTHGDRNTVLSQANEKAHHLRTALNAAPQQVVAVTISRVRVGRDRELRCDSWVDAGWTATFTGHVKVPAGLAGWTVGLVSAHDGIADHVAWGIEADHPAHREVRIEAVLDARRAATDFAAALGLPLGEAVQFADPGLMGAATSGWQVGASSSMGRGKVAGSPVEVDLDPVPQKVTARVEATFRLGPPAA